MAESRQTKQLRLWPQQLPVLVHHRLWIYAADPRPAPCHRNETRARAQIFKVGYLVVLPQTNSFARSSTTSKLLPLRKLESCIRQFSLATTLGTWRSWLSNI